MPLITKHSEGTVIAQLPDFSCVWDSLHLAPLRPNGKAKPLEIL